VRRRPLPTAGAVRAVGINGLLLAQQLALGTRGRLRHVECVLGGLGSGELGVQSN
jgi:hypothetical protein